MLAQQARRLNSLDTDDILAPHSLDHLIIINERHLRAVLGEYEVHYNNGRPHRTLDLETPTGPPARASPPRIGRIVARPVLGGLHHEYEWLAA